MASAGTEENQSTKRIECHKSTRASQITALLDVKMLVSRLASSGSKHLANSSWKCSNLRLCSCFHGDRESKVKQLISDDFCGVADIAVHFSALANKSSSRIVCKQPNCLQLLILYVQLLTLLSYRLQKLHLNCHLPTASPPPLVSHIATMYPEHLARRP